MTYASHLLLAASVDLLIATVIFGLGRNLLTKGKI